MGGLPDPDWYFDNVLAHAWPGTRLLSPPLPGDAWLSWWRGQAARLEGGWPQLRGFVLAAGEVDEPTRQRLRTLVRNGSWTRAGRGVVSPLDVRDDDPHLVERRRHALVSAATSLRRTGHVVSGRSAAILHGLPVFAVPPLPR